MREILGLNLYVMYNFERFNDESGIDCFLEQF